MRVLLAVPHLPLNVEEIRGGVHSAVINLINGLLDQPLTVRVISFNNAVKKDTLISFGKNIDILYTPEGPFPLHSLNFLLVGAAKMKKVVANFKPDIIHYEASGAFSLINILIPKKIPTLLTIHGIAVAEGKVDTRIRTKLSSYFNGLLENWLMPKNIIHLSNYSKNIYSQSTLALQEIIPNAVTSSYFNIAVKSQTDNQLLYVGVISENKNILYLLQNMKILISKNQFFKLSVLGDFKEPHYKEIVMNYVEENQLSPYVQFNGWITQKDALQFIEKADILVVSSKQESLPMVIAECMAAGKTILASTTGGIPEMIEDNVNGYLFDNKISDSLSQKLSLLYNENKKINECSNHSKALAKQKYDYKNVAEKTFSFYKKMLEI
jgi:glycosyltransferase involved in cell wall biosynthesis